jgi:hypothetical protein
MNARYNTNQTIAEAAGNPGVSFWRSVWKRIEVTQSRPERVAGVRELPLQPPRDYVVESEGVNLAG